MPALRVVGGFLLGTGHRLNRNARESHAVEALEDFSLQSLIAFDLDQAEQRG